MSLDDTGYSFDKVIEGNVIHLLDEPLKTLSELGRVCKPGEKLIIPMYMNDDFSRAEHCSIKTDRTYHLKDSAITEIK